MGLHLQRDKKVSSKLQFCPARPLRSHDDGSIYACLRPASHQNMPQTRGTCHGELNPFHINVFSSVALGRHGSSDSYQR